MHNHIYTLSTWFKEKFGQKVFKAGLSINKLCPHRVATGGCIFCLPDTFTASTKNKDLSTQLSTTISNIQTNVPKVKAFIAYFQDETSTAEPLAKIKESVQIVRQNPLVAGICFSTRPDYISDALLAYLASLDIFVSIEIGVQSIHDASLKLLNRGHDFAMCEKAIERCTHWGIHTGVHLMMGIPTESKEAMLATIKWAGTHPYINEIKLHNIVGYTGTQLVEQAYPLMTIDEYINFFPEIIKEISGDKVISRLFTSNLARTQIATNIYGHKKLWLNQLKRILKEKNIVQGENTEQVYTCK